MNSWFVQLNALIALRESGALSEQAFEDHKKRLWQLEQDLAALGKRIDSASEEYAHNERFQMRLMEMQIEPDGLDLSGREQWLIALKNAFEKELSSVSIQGNDTGGTDESAIVDEVALSLEECQLIKSELDTLVAELRDRITTLRGERLDADIWTRADQIEDALYRNGSEHVNQWRQRVLLQSDLLTALERE